MPIAQTYVAVAAPDVAQVPGQTDGACPASVTCLAADVQDIGGDGAGTGSYKHVRSLPRVAVVSGGEAAGPGAATGSAATGVELPRSAPGSVAISA